MRAKTGVSTALNAQKMKNVFQLKLLSSTTNK